jgi:hypothetical protein
MDSTLYKYLIDELLNDTRKDFSSLPIHFIKSPREVSASAFKNLESFLSDRIASSQSFSEGQWQQSLFLCTRDNFFSELLLLAHQALLEILQGSDTNTHPFHSNGIQLLKFLTYCSCNGVPGLFCKDDGHALSMMCFLLEGMMYCGWCPDAFESASKRAAHEYCITLKKSLHHFKHDTTGPVLGYLWAAWLLAQKTEGIRVVREISLPVTQTFQWNLGNSVNAFIVENSIKPNIFYILSQGHERLPHPFTKLSNENLVGLNFSIDSEPVFATEIVEYSEINRIKKHGHKFIFDCVTKACIGFRRTVVVLLYERTFYRIDLLVVPENIKTATLRAELCLESTVCLEKTGNNSYFGKGVENMTVEFIENPLELAWDGQRDNGIAKFKSGPKNVSGTETITIVTAWAQGKGITEINKTHLLGIYD